MFLHPQTRKCSSFILRCVQDFAAMSIHVRLKEDSCLTFFNDAVGYGFQVVKTYMST